MKKVDAFNLDITNIARIKEAAKSEGRSKSDWLNRHLTGVFTKEDFAPIKKKAVVKKFNFKDQCLLLNINEDTLSDWLEVRRKKKASNTKTAFNGLVTQIRKSGLTGQEVVKIAVENSWSGFKAEWIKPKSSRPDFSDDSTEWVNKDWGLI